MPALLVTREIIYLYKVFAFPGTQQKLFLEPFRHTDLMVPVAL